MPVQMRPRRLLSPRAGHPLAKGLTVDLPFVEAGGLTVRNTVNGLQATLDSGTVWSPDRWGLSPSRSSAARLGTYPPSATWQTPRITVIATGVLLASMSGYIFSCEPGTFNAGIGWYYDGSSVFRPYARIGAGWSDPGPGTALSVGQYVQLAQTFDGSTHKAFVDATRLFASSVSGVMTYNAAEPFTFGGTSYDTTWARFQFSVFRVWNRALEEDEIAQHAANPWELYTPRKVWAVAAAGGTTYTQSVSGGGAGSGVIVRQTNKVATGGGAGVGVLVKEARKILIGSGAGSGTLTTARIYSLLLTGAGAGVGAISKQINRALAGGGAGSGTISKIIQRALTGAGAGVGAITKQTNRILAGAGAASGAISKQVNKILAGAGAASGTISKEVNKVLSGAGAGSGALDAAMGAVTYIVNLVGGGAGSGSLAKTTQRALNGAGAGVGSLIKQINKVLTGGGAGSGALNTARIYTVILTGAGAASGALTKITHKLVSGGGAGSGTISKLIQRILTGAGNGIGALVGLLGGEIARGSVSSRDALVSRVSASDDFIYRAAGRDAERYSVTSSDSEEN